MEVEKAKLKGSLGVTPIVMMVVATAAPLTVMVANTPLMISIGNGVSAPVNALIATVIMLLFTVGFVAMSKYITNAGAFYAFIQKGLGRSIGLGSATLAVVSYAMILVALPFQKEKGGGVRRTLLLMLRSVHPDVMALH